MIPLGNEEKITNNAIQEENKNWEGLKLEETFPTHTRILLGNGADRYAGVEEPFDLLK